MQQPKKGRKNRFAIQCVLDGSSSSIQTIQSASFAFNNSFVFLAKMRNGHRYILQYSCKGKLLLQFAIEYIGLGPIQMDMLSNDELIILRYIEHCVDIVSLRTLQKLTIRMHYTAGNSHPQLFTFVSSMTFCIASQYEDPFRRKIFRLQYYKYRGQTAENELLSWFQQMLHVSIIDIRKLNSISKICVVLVNNQNALLFWLLQLDNNFQIRSDIIPLEFSQINKFMNNPSFTSYRLIDELQTDKYLMYQYKPHSMSSFLLIKIEKDRKIHIIRQWAVDCLPDEQFNQLTIHDHGVLHIRGYDKCLVKVQKDRRDGCTSTLAYLSETKQNYPHSFVCGWNPSYVLVVNSLNKKQINNMGMAVKVWLVHTGLTSEIEPKDIFMFFLLGIHQDFDEDLLTDAVTLLIDQE